MFDLSKLEHIHADIQAVHEIVSSFKGRIDGKQIGIRILRNRMDNYFFELSHYYRGADQADPEFSEENRFSTVEAAVEGALRSATMFYRSTDEGGAWVTNDSYIH
ncbi:hypothetical protein ACFQ88_07480 [Paenibacillus sp. NPDC056579]|uniref:hypothetical protein n=1 Tax=Paenibacillus sp. NPDC056579 TaxID=3345871 RepID=UPI0036B10709